MNVWGLDSSRHNSGAFPSLLATPPKKARKPTRVATPQGSRPQNENHWQTKRTLLQHPAPCHPEAIIAPQLPSRSRFEQSAARRRGWAYPLRHCATLRLLLRQNCRYPVQVSWLLFRTMSAQNDVCAERCLVLAENFKPSRPGLGTYFLSRAAWIVDILWRAAYNIEIHSEILPLSYYKGGFLLHTV